MRSWLILAYIIDRDGSEIYSGLWLQEKHWTMCWNACKHTCTHNIDSFQSQSDPLWNHIFNLLFIMWGDGMRKRLVLRQRQAPNWWRERKYHDGLMKVVKKKTVIWEVLKTGILLNGNFKNDFWSKCVK